MTDLKEKISAAGMSILALVFWVPWLLGAPFTFIYLIKEDAAYYHSFLGWVAAINIDAFAAAIWPFYWLSRLIFGS